MMKSRGAILGLGFVIGLRVGVGTITCIARPATFITAIKKPRDLAGASLLT
jgi:hypothetical protein